MKTIVKKSIVKNGTAYFMLNGNATVKFIYAQANFGDVAENSWYKEAVAFAADRQLFVGRSDGVFAPEDFMTCPPMPETLLLGR